MTNVIVCLDGLDPAYLDSVSTPGWSRIAETGTEGKCRGALPSLTNVNNVGLATAAPPAEHGVTGNSAYDPETGTERYVATTDALRRPTVFRRLVEDGKRVGVVVAKEKLRGLLADECPFVVSAQNPPSELEDAVGPAPDIYSGNASEWVLDAANSLLDTHQFDLLYVSTTDVVPHKHAPGTEAADDWVRTLDAGLARLQKRSTVLVATADHGMNRKTRCLDLERLVTREGYRADVVRLIRDRHVYHHRNLGGAAYLYLRGCEPSDLAWLSDVAGIEAAVPRHVAAERFRLPPDGIGDLLVFGDEQTVFGPIETAGDSTTDEVDIRSHGSVHERTVPYVTSVEADISFNFEAANVLPST